MSVIRQDPTTKEWVIIATERGRRPHDHEARAEPAERRRHDSGCPFCPGNEALSPSEVFRYPNEPGAAWTTRVVVNKFPALRAEGEPRHREPGPLFREMDGVGHHEVIIETPFHDRLLPLMSDPEVEGILKVYQARYRALQQDRRVKYIILFKNHGQRAGTSLEHPHTQLAATPVPPLLHRRKTEVAIGHFDDTGRCLYCDLVEEELKDRVRVIFRTPSFVVFHPFASRAPFETWIAPTEHQPSFGQVTPSAMAELASVLRRTLAALHRGLGNPDYNFIVHSAPTEDENRPYYLWHLQILPRLSTLAGFELGSGIFITTMMPEESAAFMREHLDPGPSR